MYPLDQRTLAIQMRSQGKSLTEIIELLGCARSTASCWTRNSLNESEFARRTIAGCKLGGKLQGVLVSGQARDKRLAYQDAGRSLARRRDSEHLIGCMLYWGEGRKHKNTVAMSNTDPDVLVIFKRFLDKYFSIQPREYTVNLDCYLNNGLCEIEIEDFWLGLFDLPRTCLRTLRYKNSSGTVAYKTNRHKYGICKLQINRTDVVQHIFGAIQEYVGIQKPEWLG